ncbi:MAG: VWA domain-containing protein [Vicinamibacterales bacterium]
MLTLVAVVASGSAAPAQSASSLEASAAEQAPRYRNGVDLVVLDVCAYDGDGRHVGDLEADDFVVLEDGVRQHISLVLPSGSLPLTTILLVDHSGSMSGPKLSRAIEAANDFGARQRPGDRLEIISFNHRAERVQAFDSLPGQTAMALARMKAGGTTALYDALLVAANDLTRIGPSEWSSRRVVIVLSDGEDTASLVGFEEVLPVLRRSGALVYGVSLRTDVDGRWLGGTWPLLAVARDTGARVIGVPTLTSLSSLYAQIEAEARHLYRIGYVSTNQRDDGRWRTVSVRVAVGGVRARTRTGYYAPSARGNHP